MFAYIAYNNNNSFAYAATFKNVNISRGDSLFEQIVCVRGSLSNPRKVIFKGIYKKNDTFKKKFNKKNLNLV